jgi:hypothetical protein
LPTACPDSIVTTPGTPVTFRPTDNDEADQALVIGVGAPGFGQVAVNADQSVTYLPAADYTGTDSFTYTITDRSGGTAEGVVTVLVNSRPLAQDDIAITTAGLPVTLAPLANDSDPDGDGLVLASVTTPGHGSVEILPDQKLLYRPQQGFVGTDSFTYAVVDPNGAGAAAAVTVTVTESDLPPFALPDSVATTTDMPVRISPLVNDGDPDGDPLRFVALTMPEHGAVAVNDDGTLTYTPASGFNGSDSFTYTIADGRGGTATGEIRVEVSRPNRLPTAGTVTATTAAATAITVAPLGKAADPDGDPIRLAALTLPSHGKITVNANNSVTYMPAAAFSGVDEFTYSVDDGHGGEATGLIQITVQPPPSAPLFANGYAWRRRLTVPGRPVAAETATSFVLLVSESGSWLRSCARGGKVESAAGFDLRFELENGTRLPHEIELYDGTAGRLLAWVRLPGWTLAQRQNLVLYYGKPGLTATEADPAGTWAGYLAVWNARTGVDRSGNGRHLVPGALQDGELLGPAGRYPGDAAASLADAAWCNGHAALTLQCWARPDAAALGSNRGLLVQGPRSGGDQDQGLLLRYAGSGYRSGAANVLVWSLQTSAGVARLESAANTQEAAAAALHAVWRSGELPRLYLDGSAVATSWVGAVVDSTATSGQALTGTVKSVAGGLTLGAGAVSGAAGCWLGLIDEARLRAAVPSAAFIAAEHASQSDPAGFYGIGGEDDPTALPACVAVPLSSTTSAGTHVDIDVLASAYVPTGGATPTLSAVGQPANGLATVVSGKARYTPNAGFAGSDSFTYTLTAGGRTSTARITIRVKALTQELPTPLRTVNVSTWAQLQTALAGARPGDHIVLANNGSFSGNALSLEASGTAAAPIVIRGATKLGPTIKGILNLRGDYNWLWGIRTEGQPVQVFGHWFKALRCRFYGKENRCVRLFGTKYARIGYCELTVDPFTETSISGRTGIAVLVPDMSDPPHDIQIDHNWFHDFPSKDPDDYHERHSICVLFGEDAVHRNLSIRGVVEYNRFDRCDQNTGACIEPKSSDNIFRYNTLINSNANFISRQGHNNVWLGNWIENSKGLRIYGDRNKAIGNKLINTSAGLCVMAGNGEWDIGKSAYQQQAYRVLLAGNDANRTRIGEQFGKDFTFPALETRIEAHKGPISYGLHEGTFVVATTDETLPTPRRLELDEVGPNAP